ncbi:L,D-transpeptidase family protein [Streptomyces anandii]|uniref:L,D-transpeptidase family protein n=1 Tax=Streptomyces anandii TaxID=285454 RepID=UPI003796F86A
MITRTSPAARATGPLAARTTGPLARRTAVLLAAAALLLTGCAGAVAVGDTAADSLPGRATDRPSGSATARPGTAPKTTTTTGTAPREIPGLGPRTRAAVPAGSGQVVVVTGDGGDSPDSTVVVYQRTGTGDDAGWKAGARWPAHNALKGWTGHHTAGDLRSPAGVYGLTDAGGLRPDPGTRLPYHHSRGFVSPGTGFEGESLAGSFDYVIAVDYNRVPGTSPLDWTRPLGARRGGGIWLHVDHGGPTHGCVGLSERYMKELLLTLDPDRRPVVVMGDAARLAR